MSYAGYVVSEKTLRTAPWLRCCGSLLLGVLTTVAVAVLMERLIRGDGLSPEEAAPSIPIGWVRLPEPPVIKDNPPRQPKPPAVERPPETFLPRSSDGQGIELVPGAEAFSRGPTLKPAVLLADGDVMTLVRARPQFPESAKRRGLEGFVLVEYSVLPTGGVADARVLEAEPQGVFDRAALDAVQRSRFRPRVVDGEPRLTEGLRTRLRFTLQHP